MSVVGLAKEQSRLAFYVPILRRYLRNFFVLTRLTLLEHSSDIGTALSQWDEAKNYSGGEDICLGNIVRNNDITTNVRRECAVLEYRTNHPIVCALYTTQSKPIFIQCCSVGPTQPDTCAASLIYRVSFRSNLSEYWLKPPIRECTCPNLSRLDRPSCLLVSSRETKA